MDKFQGLGAVLGQVIIYIYLWVAVVIFFLIVLVWLIAKYIHEKKNNKVENNDRRKIILRICLYLVLGVLIFVLSPLILWIFL